MIQFSISMWLNIKTVLFQVVQFSMIAHFTSIWLIDRTLSGATTTGQSGPGSDSNEGVRHISQSSTITGISPSDCFVSYIRHSLAGVLPLFRGAVSVFYSPSRQGKSNFGVKWLSNDLVPHWAYILFMWRFHFELNFGLKRVLSLLSR